MRKIRRFARFVVSQSTSQRLLAIGWDLTADYLFPMVELNGERGITTITAPRMTAALQAHLRAGGMHSKTQKCVTLSTTPAEYVAMLDVAKEILFLRFVWRFMLPRVGMPRIPLFEDNEGAIQIAKHPISNSISKHSDVRPDHFTMHSLRVSGSLSKSLAGTAVDVITKIGGWKTERIARYYIGATTSTTSVDTAKGRHDGGSRRERDNS